MAAHDPRSRDGLPGVARRVFGGMKEQAENVCWQLRAPDRPWSGQLIGAGGAHLLERGVEHPNRLVYEVLEWRWGSRFLSLGLEKTELLIGEGGPSRVGQEAIRRAADVPDVKRNRRRATRSLPHRMSRSLRRKRPQVLLHLHERVRDWHQ